MKKNTKKRKRRSRNRRRPRREPPAGARAMVGAKVRPGRERAGSRLGRAPRVRRGDDREIERGRAPPAGKSMVRTLIRRLPFWACQLLARAKVSVSPGIGFGEYGDEYVRFALIENENRTRQAVRGMKQMFREDGLLGS